MTHSFDAAIALEVRGEGRLRAALSRDWWVGNHGPYGGYVAGLMTNAVLVGTGRPPADLLTLSLHLARPMQEGWVDIVVTTEKSGARLSNVLVRAEQEDKACVLALAVLGHNHVPDSFSDIVLPEAPPPETLPDRSRSHHAYSQHYDMRPVFGDQPWSGSPSSTVGGWVRMSRARVLDLPLLAALTDTWMPAVWPRLESPAGKITVDLTIHFRSPPAPGDEGWWFIHQRTRHAERGFAEEDAEVWGSDGRLLAHSRQLLLLSRD